ncbi:hypothetical protein Cyrtocomes_00914 [Candidatus Cyrtobacter comes]|uniref:Uncharacterized protein n=2 Tax=Candidatus Cyrtobacter comes TaxID=675776 RepID=A0ABU5L8S7_9RICK|nr:hypothetical protein [Candidatus Cyrtobacter comes]
MSSASKASKAPKTSKASASKGSKNEISNRGAATVLKTYGGRTVEPVRYAGSIIGHGSYMAARFQDDGSLVLDSLGVPVPYRNIQLPS